MARISHTLSPGRLVISVPGIQSARNLEDLDVKADCVTFLALDERVSIELPANTINVKACSARCRKADLILTWPEEDEPVHPNGYAGHPADAPVEAVAPQPAQGNEVRVPLASAVRWASQRLAQLAIPECSGFQRFKAEVGLAELAFYALRSCRLGTPEALSVQVQAAEALLAEALRRRGAGEEPPEEVMSEVRGTINRVAGAVDDITLEVPPPPPIGLTADSQVAPGLAGYRWKLRDGSLLGPGIGTWKLSPAEATASVAAALAAGVRHVDTATEYGTESAVVEGIKKAGVPIDEVFVNLKVAADSAVELRQQIEASMSKLGLDRVDCLMLHRPPKREDVLEEVWFELESQVHAGRARLLGASNITAAQLEVLTRHGRKPELWPALVQLKYSPFHQGGYFVDSAAELGALWQLLRAKRVVPVGISLFNPLHSCVSPLEEPMTAAWATEQGCSAAELLAFWSCASGVCPLLRCGPHHAAAFRSEVHVRPALAAALSSLACLTETSFCPAPRDGLSLRTSRKRTVQRCDALQDKLVEVHSLRSTEGQPLNGLRGKILRFDEESGRWQVELEGISRKIRSENLSILSDDAAPASPETAGAFLKDLLSTGGSDAMLLLLQKQRHHVTCALLETVSANLQHAETHGYTRKQQVLQRLLAEIKKVLASQQPTPQTVVLPMPPLDASPLWRGPAEASRRLLHAVSALLEAQGYAICDHFASPEDVRFLADELAAYDNDFETAKIWVGKQAQGAQLSVPAVRSDRIFWVCGEHRTPQREMLWDSAGQQPSAGLAPCRPEVVMEKSTHGFPRLRDTMNRVDDFVLHGLAKNVSRLSGLAERSDAMVSIYDGGARFQKHVDNPNKDGRVLTSIVYLNSGEPWGAADGGQLRIFPEGEPPLDFAPETGRMVLFWADRLPHEVLPAKRRRMALTYWWFDRTEREAKVADLADEVGNQRLKVAEESLAQDFIAFMLSESSTPSEILSRARQLPEKALTTVAAVVGASDTQEALEGLGRLKESDLERLRGSMGKMGLA